MRLDEARDLAAVVMRACPTQQITDEAVKHWPGLLRDLTVSECLIAIGLLGCFDREIWPRQIRDRVQVIRRNRHEPTGEIYFEALDRRAGREYTGGPVCWYPASGCQGPCRACAATLQEAS